MTADLTVIIPTQGRATLPRMLASMLPENQGGYQAEVIVVADTHSPLLMDVAACAREYGAAYLEYDAGRHDWGYPQLTYGYERAAGDFILNAGDDDIYVRGAFPMIREAIWESSPGPLLFRSEMHPSPNRGCQMPTILWAQEGRIERSWVTGQNLCTPNDPARFGTWYDDYTHLSQTLRLWDGQVTWRMEIIARCY